MKLSQILFNYRGQISGRDYWVGCAVLLLVGIILHLLAFGFIYAIDFSMFGVVAGVSENMGLGMFGIMIPSILLISLLFYPYLCLYTKRLRDIGVSAWWYCAVVLVYFVGLNSLALGVYGFMTLIDFSPTDFFITGSLPGAPQEEIVAGIIADTRRMLIAGAIFNASLHAVVAIALDVVLGKIKPRSLQKMTPNKAAAFA